MTFLTSAMSFWFVGAVIVFVLLGLSAMQQTKKLSNEDRNYLIRLTIGSWLTLGIIIAIMWDTVSKKGWKGLLDELNEEDKKEDDTV